MLEELPASNEPMWGTLGTRGFEERPLCLHCLAPLRPDAHFCKRCMAPVSSYAAFGYFTQGNYEAIWSTGWILWQAMVTSRPRPLHLWGVVLIFGPNLCFGVFLLLHALFVESSPLLALSDPFTPAHLIALIELFWVYVSAMFIWRTWANARRGPPPFIEEVFR